MWLGSQPTGTVRVTVANSNPSAVRITPSTFTFNGTTWGIPQAFTLSGIPDAGTEGRDATLTFTAAGDGDVSYDATETIDVNVTNSDARVGILVSAGSVALTEGGSTGTFTANLWAAPNADVSVSVTSSDTGAVTVSPATLDFTTGNYGTAQTVTVTAVGDADASDESVNVTLSTRYRSGNSGSSATQTVVVTVNDDETPQANRAPTVANPIADLKLAASDTHTVQLGSVFSDADGDTLTYAATSNRQASAQVSLSGAALTITAGKTSDAVTISVSASDPDGASATDEFQVIVGNRAPTKQADIPDQDVQVNGTTTVALGPYFQDLDGDALTYTATSSDTAKATVAVSGNVLTITGVAEGEGEPATITVTASDGTGFGCQQTLHGDRQQRGAAQPRAGAEQPHRRPVRRGRRLHHRGAGLRVQRPRRRHADHQRLVQRHRQGDGGHRWHDAHHHRRGGGLGHHHGAGGRRHHGGRGHLHRHGHRGAAADQLRADGGQPHQGSVRGGRRRPPPWRSAPCSATRTATR